MLVCRGNLQVKVCMQHLYSAFQGGECESTLASLNFNPCSPLCLRVVGLDYFLSLKRAGSSFKPGPIPWACSWDNPDNSEMRDLAKLGSTVGHVTLSELLEIKQGHSETS